MNFPHITSRINGIKVPFLHGQTGIFHRYENPENKLIVASINPNGSTQREPEKLVINGTPEGADLTPRKPKTDLGLSVSI